MKTVVPVRYNYQSNAYKDVTITNTTKVYVVVGMVEFQEFQSQEEAITFKKIHS